MTGYVNVNATPVDPTRQMPGRVPSLPLKLTQECAILARQAANPAVV